MNRECNKNIGYDRNSSKEHSLGKPSHIDSLHLFDSPLCKEHNNYGYDIE